MSTKPTSCIPKALPIQGAVCRNQAHLQLTFLPSDGNAKKLGFSDSVYPQQSKVKNSIMLARTLLLALASAVSIVTAQSIDPDSVPLATRGLSPIFARLYAVSDLYFPDQWCESQKSSCPLLCLQLPGASETPEHNDCNSVSPILCSSFRWSFFLTSLHIENPLLQLRLQQRPVSQCL